MPIVVNLDIMLAKRKMQLTELARLLNITLPNMSILKSGKAKAMRFSTLEKICNILECKPGDILDCLNEEEYRKLYRLDKTGDLSPPPRNARKKQGKRGKRSK
jgi:putative transcriptional regulator